MEQKENGGFIQPAISKFDSHYDHWAMLIENLLRSKEYWEIVENGIPANIGIERDTRTKKDRWRGTVKDLKAKNYLFQALLDRSILETILKMDTSKDIWDSLK